MFQEPVVEFGELFTAVRRERGVSVCDLARESGLPRNTIDRWERGQALPTLTAFDAAAVALGLAEEDRRRLLASVPKPRAERLLSNDSLVGLEDGTRLQAMPTVSELLKSLRTLRGMSQSEVARATGVAKSTVGHWETGHCWPNADHLERLVEVLGANGHEAEALRKRRLSHVELSCPEQVDDVWLWFREHGLWDGSAYNEIDALGLRGSLTRLRGIDQVGRRWLVGAKILHSSTAMIRGQFSLARKLAVECHDLARTLRIQGPEYWRSLCLACLATVVEDEEKGVSWILDAFDRQKKLPNDGLYRPTLLGIKAFAVAWNQPLGEARRLIAEARARATDREAVFYIEFGRVRLVRKEGDVLGALDLALQTHPEFLMDRAIRAATIDMLKMQLKNQPVPKAHPAGTNPLAWRVAWLTVEA